MTTRGQVKHAFPAYRVYIFGEDVTKDVLEVSVRYQIGKSTNTCSITLANKLDKYIITTQDFSVLFGEQYKQAIRNGINSLIAAGSESMSDTEYERIQDDAILETVKSINSEVKRRIIQIKALERIDGIEQPDIAGNFGGSHARQLTGTAFRYPLQAEDPIFHANDPVRVFFRDPFDSKRWYHAFTGFISDFDDNVNENNQRILTIVVEGVSKLLRYARVTTNPGIVDIKAVEVSEEDAVYRSFFEAGMRGLTLPEILFSMMFGNDPDKKVSKFAVQQVNSNGSSQTSIGRFKGVGNFNYKRSAVIEYGPSSNGGVTDILDITGVPITQVGSLGYYQSLIDHEVKISDLADMMIEDVTNISNTLVTTQIGYLPVSDIISKIPYRSDGTPDPLYIMDVIGRNPQMYPVDGGALIILVPAVFHAQINREVLLKDIVQSVALTTEFKSRLSIIYDTVERIDFVFYESPKGDLICEFPLYDFDPEDFGMDQVDTLRIRYNKPVLSDVQVTPTGLNFTTLNWTRSGPFGPRYIINKKGTFNFSKGITDEKVRTQLASPYNLIKNWKTIGDTTGMMKPSVVTLRHLVPLYGLRLEQIGAAGYISSTESALMYAHITLNKLNADARNLGINAVPNIGLWLNRPLYFEPRNCIGRITSINHTIKWGMGGSMDTRVNINHIRGWDGMTVKDSKTGKIKPVFTTIGGFPSQPLNYKVLFGLIDVNKGNETPPGTENLGVTNAEIPSV